MAKLKTPEYTRKAINEYNSKHDRITLTLDLGEKDNFKSVGMDADEIRRILREEYEKRAAEQAEKKAKREALYRP